MVLTCGIDEAGRGPVIGPMVLAGVLVEESDLDKLRNMGIKDSKMLTPRRRSFLFNKIKEAVNKYEILVIDPVEIDAALKSDHLNLNWLEAHKAAEIINVLNPDKAVIDSPSNNCAAYKRYLRPLLKHKDIDLVVEHKADVNHVECSAASILAKVTRDIEIGKIKQSIGDDFGSGYLTDPKTKAFLEKKFSVHPEIFRKTWMPYKDMVNVNKHKKLDEF